MSHVSEGSIESLVDTNDQQSGDHGLRQSSEPSQPESTFAQARQRHKIAELEGKLEAMQSGRAMKEKYEAHHDCMH